VFEPCLYPATDNDESAHLSLFSRSLRNNWREASAVADAQEVDAIGIDKLVVFKGAKGRAIAGKLGIEIIFRTISFAIADALFIDAEKAEPGNCASCRKSMPVSSLVFSGASTLSQLNQPATKTTGSLPFGSRGLVTMVRKRSLCGVVTES
jgi:hypothetical protein